MASLNKNILHLKKEESLWRDPNLAGALFSPEDDLDWVSQNSYFIIFISVRSSLCKLTVSCFAEVTRQGLRLVAGAWNESTADKKNFSTFLLFANRWRACYSCFRLVFLFSFRLNIPIFSLLFLSCLHSANVLGPQIWCNFCIFIFLAFISCVSVCFCNCCLFCHPRNHTDFVFVCLVL